MTAFQFFQRLSIASMLLSLIIFSACGGNSDGAPEASRQFLSVGTAPPGGAFFVVGGAIAEVADAFAKPLPWQVNAEATKGTQENIRRLAGGELDFALANAAISYFAVRGEGKWEGEQPIRTVMTLAPNVALFIAQQSSDVKTIADLKGESEWLLARQALALNTFWSPSWKRMALPMTISRP